MKYNVNMIPNILGINVYSSKYERNETSGSSNIFEYNNNSIDNT